ncbi:peptidase associated/transthyretin-like domain-containing protein [Ferruginibacter profundus]
MKRTIFTFLFIAAVIFSQAQIVIKGRVVDSKSDLAIANASIYLNNTSIGAITNARGEFVITTSSIYSGELIISSIGYQALSYRLDSKDADKHTYTFKLDIKENEMKDVLVMNDLARQQWLKIFKDNFLGITEEGDNCKIVNLKAVYFTTGKDKNTIYAYADSPLIIINKMLGYKISFDLIEFNFNKENHSTYFVGYNRYEDMGDKRRWTKRRRENYFGSTMHFYRSLISDSLKEEGYSILAVTKKQITDTLKREKVWEITKKDTFVTQPTTARKILFSDSTGNYYLKADGKITVNYNKVPHTKAYLVNKVFVEGLSHYYGFTAYINLMSDKVALDGNGIIIDPMQVIYNGYWVYEKMCNQLPFNYTPD